MNFGNSKKFKKAKVAKKTVEYWPAHDTPIRNS